MYSIRRYKIFSQYDFICDFEHRIAATVCNIVPNYLHTATHTILDPSLPNRVISRGASAILQPCLITNGLERCMYHGRRAAKKWLGYESALGRSNRCCSEPEFIAQFSSSQLLT